MESMSRGKGLVSNRRRSGWKFSTDVSEAMPHCGTHRGSIWIHMRRKTTDVGFCCEHGGTLECGLR